MKHCFRADQTGARDAASFRTIQRTQSEEECEHIQSAYFQGETRPASTAGNTARTGISCRAGEAIGRSITSGSIE